MRYFMPSPNDSTGGRRSSAVPSVMDTDPNADEEIIDQHQDSTSPPEQYPKPVKQHETESAKIVPDNLADSIAYALDGSGPGPTNDTPNVSGHKVITEGITGAGPEDEEDTLRD